MTCQHVSCRCGLDDYRTATFNQNAPFAHLVLLIDSVTRPRNQGLTYIDPSTGNPQHGQAE